jgi:hypothetical protein
MNDLQRRLAIPEKQLIADPAGRILVGELYDVLAMPDDVQDDDLGAGNDAANPRITLDLFKSCHVLPQYGVPKGTPSIVSEAAEHQSATLPVAFLKPR